MQLTRDLAEQTLCAADRAPLLVYVCTVHSQCTARLCLCTCALCTNTVQRASACVRVHCALTLYSAPLLVYVCTVHSHCTARLCLFTCALCTHTVQRDSACVRVHCALTLYSATLLCTCALCTHSVQRDSACVRVHCALTLQWRNPCFTSHAAAIVWQTKENKRSKFNLWFLII